MPCPAPTRSEPLPADPAGRAVQTHTCGPNHPDAGPQPAQHNNQPADMRPPNRQPQTTSPADHQPHTHRRPAEVHPTSHPPHTYGHTGLPTMATSNPMPPAAHLRTHRAAHHGHQQPNATRRTPTDTPPGHKPPTSPAQQSARWCAQPVVRSGSGSVGDMRPPTVGPPTVGGRWPRRSPGCDQLGYRRSSSRATATVTSFVSVSPGQSAHCRRRGRRPQSPLLSRSRLANGHRPPRGPSCGARSTPRP